MCGATFALEPALVLGRNVAGDDEREARAPRHLDGDVRPLDLLDAAQEHQRRIRCDRRLEVIGAERHTVVHEVPSANVLDVPRHPPADCGELQRAARQAMAELDRAAADLALVSHQLRDRQWQDRHHVGDARERMDEIVPPPQHGVAEGGRIPDGVGAGEARGSGPGHEPAGRPGVAMGEQRDVVPALDQRANEHVDDALNAAVVKRRHGKLGIGGDRNLHALACALSS